MVQKTLANTPTRSLIRRVLSIRPTTSLRVKKLRLPKLIHWEPQVLKWGPMTAVSASLPICPVALLSSGASLILSLGSVGRTGTRAGSSSSDTNSTGFASGDASNEVLLLEVCGAAARIPAPTATPTGWKTQHLSKGRLGPSFPGSLSDLLPRKLAGLLEFQGLPSRSLGA